MLPFLKYRPRLLFLDDDPSMQRLVASVLKRAGYRVDIVSSGAQAIEHLRRRAYDALLLDVMTPTEGGLTVIRHLREASPALIRRVILVTASPQAALQSVRNDVYAIVHKPFEPENLVATIDRLVRV